MKNNRALLPASVISESLKNLSYWKLTDSQKQIEREYGMKNFTQAVLLINQIKDAAESLNHHPDIHLTAYKRLKLELTTHSAGGLTSLDFLLAEQIEKLHKQITS